MRITEIFESIQGEGPLLGRPMLFIRLSGCNLRCEWCDTKYAWEGGTDMPIVELTSKINSSDMEWVCWTGGEPLLQIDDIRDVIKSTGQKKHSVETNGTIHVPDALFDMIVVSPKNLDERPPLNADAYKFVIEEIDEKTMDKINSYLNEYSIPREKSFVQPQATTQKEASIKNRKMWDLCVKYQFALSPRLHTLLFGNKRGV